MAQDNEMTQDKNYNEMAYRKKPVVIEAFQMTKARREDNSEWPNWLNIAWNKNFNQLWMVSSEDYPYSNGKDLLIIRTFEDVTTVDWDDWIIQGVNNELYTCTPDIFEQTYEPVKRNRENGD